MSKKLTMPKPVKGYGYSGVWRDGKIGYFIAKHVTGKNDRRYPSAPDSNSFIKGKRVFLCEITIKPLKDKKGRPITKIMK